MVNSINNNVLDSQRSSHHSLQTNPSSQLLPDKSQVFSTEPPHNSEQINILSTHTLTSSSHLSISTFSTSNSYSFLPSQQNNLMPEFSLENSSSFSQSCENPLCLCHSSRTQTHSQRPPPMPVIEDTPPYGYQPLRGTNYSNQSNSFDPWAPTPSLTIAQQPEKIANNPNDALKTERNQPSLSASRNNNLESKQPEEKAIIKETEKWKESKNGINGNIKSIEKIANRLKNGNLQNAIEEVKKYHRQAIKSHTAVQLNWKKREKTTSTQINNCLSKIKALEEAQKKLEEENKQQQEQLNQKETEYAKLLKQHQTLQNKYNTITRLDP
jgi:hypothetical protein